MYHFFLLILPFYYFFSPCFYPSQGGLFSPILSHYFHFVHFGQIFMFPIILNSNLFNLYLVPQSSFPSLSWKDRPQDDEVHNPLWSGSICWSEMGDHKCRL